MNIEQILNLIFKLGLNLKVVNFKFHIVLLTSADVILLRIEATGTDRINAFDGEGSHKFSEVSNGLLSIFETYSLCPEYLVSETEALSLECLLNDSK